MEGDVEKRLVDIAEGVVAKAFKLASSITILE